MFFYALNRALKILTRSCDQFQKISKSLEFIIFIQFPWGDSVLHLLVEGSVYAQNVVATKFLGRICIQSSFDYFKVLYLVAL